MISMCGKRRAMLVSVIDGQRPQIRCEGRWRDPYMAARYGRAGPVTSVSGLTLFVGLEWSSRTNPTLVNSRSGDPSALQSLRDQVSGRPSRSARLRVWQRRGRSDFRTRVRFVHWFQRRGGIRVGFPISIFG